MKHKILKVNSESADAVLISVFRDEEDLDFVEICAWHLANTADDYRYQHEIVALPTLRMCEQFVKDFSEESAQTFVDSFQF